MNNVYSSLLEDISKIRKKRSMYFVTKNDTPNIDEFIIYFKGVFYGIYLAKQINIERLLSKWYQEKYKLNGGNMDWFYQIELLTREKEEGLRIDVLLRELKEFLTEKDSASN